MLKSQFYNGNHQEVVSKAEKYMSMLLAAERAIDPSEFFYLGFWHFGAKNVDLALDYFDKAVGLAPDNTWSLFARVYKSLIEGKNEEAIRVITKLETRNIIDSEMNYRFAHFYSWIGETEKALNSLRKSIEGGFFCYPYISTDPLLNSIRDTEEYVAILREAKARHEDFKNTYAGTLEF